MSKTLKIAVYRDRYPTRFNTPRLSRHRIAPALFLPTHKISHHIEGLTVAASLGADLLHAVNRIPLIDLQPFIISFESHLPRYFGGEQTALFNYMRRRLASDSCRRIIAMSHFAERLFRRQHAGSPERDRLMAKLEVVYPNIHLPDCRTLPNAADQSLRLTFVGSHFGRKGGAVAVRAAEIARERQLPLHVTVVSALQTGRGIWSDPQQPNFFAPYLRLLDAPNVTFHRKLSNPAILQLLRDSDFSLLTTFSDTFGFSAVESLGAGTPVIATPQGALPELITHGANGYMVPLPVNADGEWQHIARTDKHQPAFAALVRDEIERMAQAAIERLMPHFDRPATLEPLRRAARRRAETLFDTVKTSAYLDSLYDRSAA